MTEKINPYKVSIIIPAYNEEKYLPLCLDAISRLNWPKDRLEVIVVDNGSTDRTCSIAAAYNVTLLKDATKKVSGLRNLGAEHASGSILAFVDADCLVSEDWLVDAEKYFNDFEIVAWGSHPEIPEHATWVQKTWSIVWRKQNEIEKVDWLASMNLFVRKDLFKQNSGFDETLVTCEDVDFLYRLSKHGAIISDKQMKVIHLGEAATVGMLIKKEIWRGMGNFRGMLNHGLTWKELPSLAIPLYFGIFIPAVLLIALLQLSWLIFSAGIVLFLLPGAGVLYKVRKRKAGLLTRCQLFFLVHLYFLARTLATLKRSDKR